MDPQATIRKFRIVRPEGGREVSRSFEHYNLEAIQMAGLRVRLTCGAWFRHWANERLQGYLAKEFVMDDEWLWNPAGPGTSPVPDYFDELLAHESALVLDFAFLIAAWAIRRARETGYAER